MPISRLRKKRKNKKGPTPKSEGMNVKEMHRIFDILDEAERRLIAEQETNDEENQNG